VRTGNVLPSASNYYNKEVALNELLFQFLIGGGGGATATLTQVADNASSVTLLAANDSRRGFVIVNTSSAILFIAFAATATTSTFTYRLVPTATLECFGNNNFTGVISGIWASDPGTGSAVITEFEVA